jgi:hypothetical protein
MTNTINLVIDDLDLKLPAFLRPSDLIDIGLYKSRSDICWSMKRGKAPPSIKLSTHKVVFPRAALCDWLRKKAEIAELEYDQS